MYIIFRLFYDFLVQNFSFEVSDMVYFHHRRWVLERKLASSDVPKDVQINLIKDLERKETEFMRLKRNKICVDDFELLTVIGRGAFGEVSIVQNAHGDWLSYSLYFISFFPFQKFMLCNCDWYISGTVV